ncbi:hypothetical protein LINPERHAP2_LOCUS14493 [Linum perenne]
MASTTGIHCGGAIQLKNQHHRLVLTQGRPRPAMLRFNSDVSNCRLERIGVSASSIATAAITKSAAAGRKKTAEAMGERRTNPSEDNLEQWMRESVTEIVKSLTEGPLLVHVFADEEGRKRLETEEAADEGDWRRLSEKWRKRESKSPEGVIFVEQIRDGEDNVAAATKEWGVVVQGRGARCGPVCYLLKTSRVGSGVGPLCTHFCLMRVRSFRETARSQLKNCWLLQAQYGDGGLWSS